ncbi:chemosensory receptor A [Elysia marginata]|uniref:Chemosensory receptor A n=1 Tax=Elysia marginata TaxID=1093978 RepID=A0AAV4IHC9_9GAST|nr:chemosensory receptor A [Elysia marginata]
MSTTAGNSTLNPWQSLELSFFAEMLMTIKVLSTIGAGIILFGLVSNITNIVVFLKAGAKDNVTILLLSLAVSDLVFLHLITPSMFSFVIFSLFPLYTWPFDVNFVRYLFYWPAYTAYDLSTYISVFLAVTRCACVAMPLKFKHVFTKSRTLKWVMLLVLIAVSLRLPVLTINRISRRTDPETNMTSLYLKHVNNDEMSRINDILNRGSFIYVSYVTMVTCVVIIMVKLRQAAKIRQSCTENSTQSRAQTSDKPAPLGLSSKDLQVVKSVALVCTIFILLQLPFVLVSTIRLIIPEFNDNQPLKYLFGIFSRINGTCACLNASINIFVYYNYNSKFRSTLRSMVKLK